MHAFRLTFLLIGFVGQVAQAQVRNQDQPLPTLSFKPAVVLKAGTKPVEVGSHAAVRFADLDGDSQVDMLVGDGKGRLWFYRNLAGTKFAQRKPITAGKRDQWGSSYTGVVIANLLGNELADLVVAHSDNQITIHENSGTRRKPSFAGQTVEFTVQKGCQGRFDIADWDSDGLLDLVTGSFGGKVMWHRNTGSKGAPKYGVGESFFGISSAYNSHPRIIDFNQDGLLDLALGVNWGTVSLFLNKGTTDTPALKSSQRLLWSSDGKTLNIRSLNGDDTTPEFIDYNLDGVLDLVSGGKNGRLFVMRGVSSSGLNGLRDLFAKHSKDLGSTLHENESVRNTAFASLKTLRADMSMGLLPTRARQSVYEQLIALAGKYPQFLGRRRFDLEATPELPLLAAQFWVALFESRADSKTHRENVARVLGFQQGYRRLLVDLGVIFIDNNTATVEQLDAMHRLMMAMPRATWDVETITVAGWLGTAFKTQKIASRTGVNIFAMPLGRPENSFANDAPRKGVTDVYMICLAHELAHNMLDTVGKRTRPDLYERKFEYLDQAAGDNVVYKTPRSKGIDFAATKAKFKAAGAWDGSEKSWATAWKDYFKNKQQFDRSYVRGNVHFFLNAPQEAFATLANQYFADSQLMLEFCKTRWDAGYRSNINQFLLITDYLSEGTNRVSFFTMTPGARITVAPVTLTRDKMGRIKSLRSKNSIATFTHDGNIVTGFEAITQ